MMRNSYAYTKYFYDFEEILIQIFKKEMSLDMTKFTWALTQKSWTDIYKLFAVVFGISGSGDTTYFSNIFNDETPKELKMEVVDLLNFIFARHKKDYILTSTKDEFENEPSEEFELEIYNFFNQLYSKINYSAPYYLKMLGLYKANESKLMDNLSNELEGYVKNSDTPQNIDSTLSPLDADKHVSSISQNKSKSTFATKDTMEKLNAVRDGYRNLIKNWASEFDGMFIEESNV